MVWNFLASACQDGSRRSYHLRREVPGNHRCTGVRFWCLHISVFRVLNENIGKATSSYLYTSYEQQKRDGSVSCVVHNRTRKHVNLERPLVVYCSWRTWTYEWQGAGKKLATAGRSCTGPSGNIVHSGSPTLLFRIFLLNPSPTLVFFPLES